jgi:hypothetical protein
MTFTALTKDQRNLLARAVIKARTEAEAGARAALVALAVDHDAPFNHMNDPACNLRNSLRAHGRQLGDALDARGRQEIARLTHEVAFEHWHRMLFARFLAENNLLIHPDAGVAVSIDDCVDLAREQGKSPWELAASFAQDSLPAIFRKEDPALLVTLPLERRTEIEKLVTGLPSDIFTATDALGWVYQFWQAEKKDEVNAAGNKIGAEELPSVTQLFTEDYMVDFLLDNALGAWHAGKVLAANPKLAQSAESEDALRSAVSLPGCPWKYLRFIKDQDGTWKPAAGTFDGWPKNARELKCLDPCMGSGHFVVAMFQRMVDLRIAAENCTELEAVERVIRDNIFGLEIDPRCTQIAAFNLALAAWRRVGHCKLPAMNLACSGLAPNMTELKWIALAGNNVILKNGMARLYQLFKQAPELGSLINPRSVKDEMYEASFYQLQPLLEKALAQDNKDDAAHEMAVAARGLAKAAEILAGQFTLVATNVPYLGRNKHVETLADYCERVHPKAKADLATCFVERGLIFCSPGGCTALVTPQNWLFLGKYKELRKQLLTTVSWHGVVRLGEHGFGSSQAAGAFTAFAFLGNVLPKAAQKFFGIDVASLDSPEKKAVALETETVTSVYQKQQLGNPDARIGFGMTSSLPRLIEFGRIYQGIGTSDGPRFIQNFWEASHVKDGWVLYQTAPERDGGFSGFHSKLLWCDGGGPLVEVCQKDAQYRGKSAWGKRGVALAVTRNVNRGEYLGAHFDCTFGALVTPTDTDLMALRAFVMSEEFVPSVRAVDQALSITETSFGKVPFDLAHWQKVAAEKYPHGLPKPFSSDPTQCLFNGHPAGADQPLHVAVARLLGYQWPRQTGSSFPDCPALGPDGLEKLADDDGIVPINPVRGEPAADERVVALLRDAYKSAGIAFDHNMIGKLIAESGSKCSSIGEWLLTDFFDQHCKLFHHRPFLWHIWDGRKDGFNVLVNYHLLSASGDGGRQLLEKLTYAYLKDWIDRQHAGVKNGDAGAEARLAAAVKLQKELIKIIDGEAPYDIFVRWKPMSEQAVGWHPDINDGVRMNIRPFLLAEDVGKKDAGILRMKPNIKWDKNLGKEPERPKKYFPWFWSCKPNTNSAHENDFTGGPVFTGERWNEVHYTLAVKKAARGEQT